MADQAEDLEPLFDYSRVQPFDRFHFDDEDLDTSAIFEGGKRKRQRKCVTEVKGNDGDEKVVVLDDEAEVKGKDEDDWMPPPPPRVPKIGSGIEEDSTIKELRLKKQELASLAQSAEDILRSVATAATRESNSSEKCSIDLEEEQPSKQVDREKIIITVQDKDGQKQFRMYTDDTFERLFKMYAEKAKLKLESLSFSFDGDKVSPTTTPRALGLENDDMIEVHIKTK